jgi:hypothetical protein
MFEIGNSLHEARIRHGYDLLTAESATMIRAKYLKALEEEQFDSLPAETYVRGFLRAYADFLGLDGQLYVDEYNSRFVIGDDGPRTLRPRRSNARPERRSSSRLESNVVLVTLAAIGIVAALVIVAWKSGDRTNAIQPNLRPVAATPVLRVKPTSVRLVVTARHGNCVLEAHANSQSGRLLYQGTLLQGKSVPLAAKRLWLSVGTPRNIAATLNGHRVRLAYGSAQRTLLVTTAGVRAATAS